MFDCISFVLFYIVIYTLQIYHMDTGRFGIRHAGISHIEVILICINKEGNRAMRPVTFFIIYMIFI